MDLEKKKHLAPTGIEAGTVQPVVILYKDYVTWLNNTGFFSPVALRPNAGHGLLILEVSRSHTTTHHIR
jgi:hypothetical protein